MFRRQQATITSGGWQAEMAMAMAINGNVTED